MYKYTPRGVCARQINIELDGDIIVSVEYIGGCVGNHAGISSLVKGMKIDDVIERLQGIRCRGNSSCPDQLAKALIQIRQARN